MRKITAEYYDSDDMKDKYEIIFFIKDSATDREVVDKAFEIAMCRTNNLEKVYINSFGDE